MVCSRRDHTFQQDHNRYLKVALLIAATHTWKYYFGINNLFSLIRKPLRVLVPMFVPTQTLQVQRNPR